MECARSILLTVVMAGSEEVNVQLRNLVVKRGRKGHWAGWSPGNVDERGI